MLSRIALALCAAGLVGVPACASASSASTKPPRPANVRAACQRPADLVDVMLPARESDGDPLTVACGGISDVRDCAGRGYARTCRATLDGVRGYVWVAGVDFPGIAYRSTR